MILVFCTCMCAKVMIVICGKSNEKRRLKCVLRGILASACADSAEVIRHMQKL